MNEKKEFFSNEKQNHELKYILENITRMKKHWINNFEKPVDWISIGYEIFQIKPVLKYRCLYLLKSLGCKSMTPSNWIHVNPMKVKFDFCQSAHIFGELAV